MTHRVRHGEGPPLVAVKGQRDPQLAQAYDGQGNDAASCLEPENGLDVDSHNDSEKPPLVSVGLYDGIQLVDLRDG